MIIHIQQVPRRFDFDAVGGERFVAHHQRRDQRVLLDHRGKCVKDFLPAAAIDGAALDHAHHGRTEIDAEAAGVGDLLRRGTLEWKAVTPPVWQPES